MVYNNVDEESDEKKTNKELLYQSIQPITNNVC